MILFNKKKKRKECFLIRKKNRAHALNFIVQISSSKNPYFFFRLAICVGTELASVFAAILAFLEAARQFTCLPVHQ